MDDYELFAVNGTTIAIYGTILLSLNLCLRRDFKWRFIVADVPKPIIGMDFLRHYGPHQHLRTRIHGRF
jgi:hypothetical protein